MCFEIAKVLMDIMATHRIQLRSKTDKRGYDECYRGQISRLSSIDNPDNFLRHFDIVGLSPYYKFPWRASQLQGEYLQSGYCGEPDSQYRYALCR